MSRSRPNVLCIISDDTAPRYLGAYGGSFLTPHLDRLASEGVRFADAHVSTPICTPSRYSYLTGCYANRGITTEEGGDPTSEITQIFFNSRLQPGEANLPTLMKSAGYRTGYVGKVHHGRKGLAVGEEPIPANGDPWDAEADAARKRNQQRYIDELKATGWDYAASLTWGNIEGNEPRAGWNHNQEWITQGGLDFLEQQQGKDEPFCLYMATNVIHGPEHGDNLASLNPRISYGGILDEAPDCQPDRQTLVPRLEEAGVVPTHRSVGMLWLDDAIGALLAKLEEMGELDNTIIIYKADHGVTGKFSCYDSGTHVPLIWRLPGGDKAGHLARPMVQNIDFLPTLCELCGVEMPHTYTCDGTSYAAALRGDQTEIHDELYFEFGFTRAVRTKRWKYIATRYRPEKIRQMAAGEMPALNLHGNRKFVPPLIYQRNVWEPEQLYQTPLDFEEQLNVVDWPDNAATLAELRERLRGYTDRFNPAFPRKPDPFQLSDRFRMSGFAESRINPALLENQPWWREGWF